MPWFRDNELVFKKSGAEIKEVVRARIVQPKSTVGQT